MRSNRPDSPAERFGFEDDADEELWATRDYFWALHARLLDGHSAQTWSSFRSGYAWRRDESQCDYEPPTQPVQVERRRLGG